MDSKSLLDPSLSTGHEFAHAEHNCCCHGCLLVSYVNHDGLIATFARTQHATCAKSKTMKNVSFELNAGDRERRGVRVFVYSLLIEKQWNLIVICVLKVLKTPMY